MGRIKENLNLIVADIKESSRNIKELVATFVFRTDIDKTDSVLTPELQQSLANIESGSALVERKNVQSGISFTLDQEIDQHIGVKERIPENKKEKKPDHEIAD